MYLHVYCIYPAMSSPDYMYVRTVHVYCIYSANCSEMSIVKSHDFVKNTQGIITQFNADVGEDTVKPVLVF